jgi:hypothetical protein
MADRSDSLLKFFDEHSTQARRHEDQRERMTNLILVISGALVAFIGQSSLATYTLPAALLMIFLGLFGWLFAKKHYERNQLHVRTVGEIREEIDRELGVLPWPEQYGTRLPKRSLGALRDAANKRHYGEFGKRHEKVLERREDLQRKAYSWVARSRLHLYWEGLHIVVMLIGLMLAAIILIKSQPPIRRQVQEGTGTAPASKR